MQDEWQATPDLRIHAGLRLDAFTGGDVPAFNANFAGRYGFSNQATLDGRELLDLHHRSE